MEKNAKDPNECCPEFDPEPWNSRVCDWNNKLFATDHVTSFFHVPLNMGQIVTRMMKKIEDAGALSPEFLMLSHDPSPWKSAQYIAVEKEVPGMRHEKMSGTYYTKVFEGPYHKAKDWYGEMIGLAGEKGKKAGKVYFYYTTCPKCARKYGKNYVVGFVQAL